MKIHDNSKRSTDTDVDVRTSGQTGRKVRGVTGIGKRDLFNYLQNGFDISITTVLEGDVRHSVMLNRVTKQTMTVFGIPVTRYIFHVMNPAVGGGAYIRTPGSALIRQRTFLLFPCYP